MGVGGVGMWGWRCGDDGDNANDMGMTVMMWGQCGDNVETMWGPQGCGDHVETTWGPQGCGDNMGTTGMWRPCGDNKITKNAITFE